MAMPQMSKSYPENSLILFQPEDVSHIYQLGLRLHELKIKKKPKKNNCIKKDSEVKSK